MGDRLWTPTHTPLPAMATPGRPGEAGTRSPAVTVEALVDELARTLAGGSASDPWREGRDIVAAVLDVPRLWPVRYGREPLDGQVVDACRRAAAQRSRGMPFEYAVGRAAFRHLTLEVDQRVLIPRPETEVLVDRVLSAIGASGGIAVDVGTGSGAIALALASEGRFDHVIGTDVSADALAVAVANGRRSSHVLNARVEFRLGSYLAPVLETRARAVVSNPPYISFEEAGTLPDSVRRWEPVVALLAADGGMAALAAIASQAGGILEPGGLLAMEVDAGRATRTAQLVAADRRYADVVVHADLTGRERFITAVRTWS